MYDSYLFAELPRTNRHVDNVVYNEQFAYSELPDIG